MKYFIEGLDRHQVTPLPESLGGFVGADKPVRVIAAFVEELDRPVGRTVCTPLAGLRPQGAAQVPA